MLPFDGESKYRHFLFFFEDNKAQSEQRQKYISQHLNFLNENSIQIRDAGPIYNSEDTSAAGGVWLVEALNLDEVKILVETDPFWPTGLRKNVKILLWNRVFSEGKKSPPCE